MTAIARRSSFVVRRSSALRETLRALPVRWQITVLHATILTLVLATVGALLWVQQRNFQIESAATRLRAQARPLIEARLGVAPFVAVQPRRPRPPRDLPAAPLAPAPPPAPPLRAALTQLAQDLATRDTSALILALDGTPLARDSHGPTAPVSDTRTLALAASGTSEQQFIARADNERLLAVIVPLWHDGRVVALAQISTPLRPVDDALARLALYLALGGLLAVALATLLGVRATRHVLRPLEQIVGVTQRIAAGDLSQRVGLPPGRTEIATLGAGFDTMLDRLEASFAAQRRFVADAAHELRTPLTALSASVELLQFGADEAHPAQTQRLLGHLDSEIHRLTRLTNDLLTLSALDAQPHIALRPTDVSQLAQEVGEQYRAMLAGQSLTLAIAPGLHAQADPDRLRQVLLNLLDNARKYTPADGTITLRLWLDDMSQAPTTASQQPPYGSAHPLNRAPVQSLIIEVQDNGAGIAAEALPHLFERFYRVDTARARRQGGSGLGLAIVQAIVQAHGGQISVDSAPGGGTTFTIYLPLYSPSANLQLSSGGGSASDATLHP